MEAVARWLWDNYSWLQTIPIVARVSWWLLMKTGMKYAMVISNRRDLQYLFPISQAIKRGDKIYALWLSGIGVLDNMTLEDRRSIKKIIMPSPDNPSLCDLEHYADNAKGYIFSNMAQKIKDATRLAQAGGTEVKYWRNYPGMSLTFGDPSGDNGWLHIELLLPQVEPGRRTVFRIDKKNNSEMFGEYWEIFNQLWANSTSPPKT